MNSVGSMPEAREVQSMDRTTWILGLFLLGHLVLWTLLPSVLHPNLPLDSVEMYSWGQHWDLGYHKHPPLPAWIASGIAHVVPGAAWPIYLAVQVCIVTCFWAAWRLGREMVSPQLALLGAFLLECCYYYTFEAIDLNNNTVLYPFWALAILTFYWAITREHWGWWMATGVLVGLAMLCKYSAAVLAITMLAYGVLYPEARKWWRTPCPYLMVLAALLVFSPHLWWAIGNDFPPLRYAMNRTEGGGVWYGHVTYPLEFGSAQLLAVLPMLLVMVPLTGWRWRKRTCEPSERFNRDFLLAMVLGPFVFHLLVSFVLNIRLRSMYGSNLWTFAGLAMVFLLQLDTSSRQWRKAWGWCAAVAAIMVAPLALRSMAAPYVDQVLRIHFPGRELAAEVETLWRRQEKGPLPLIAGDGWLGGNVAFYSGSHPPVFEIAVEPDDDSQRKRPSDIYPGIDDAQLAEQGGIVLWDADKSDAMPAEYLDHFPPPSTVEVFEFRPHTRADVPPLRIGAAVYPKRR